MTDDKMNGLIPHNLILEDRKKLSLSGIKEVGSFNEETITTTTELGELTVSGTELHITKLSLETGDLMIEGRISSLSYTDVSPKTSGFFSRQLDWWSRVRTVRAMRTSSRSSGLRGMSASAIKQLSPG